MTGTCGKSGGVVVVAILGAVWVVVVAIAVLVGAAVLLGPPAIILYGLWTGTYTATALGIVGALLVWALRPKRVHY